jgi:hypothetical protein
MKDVANMIGALAAMAAIFLLYQQFTQRMADRVVPSGGVLMAVDADGLRELYELYAVPKVCGDRNFAKKADPQVYFARCFKAVRITPDLAKKGTVLLRAGTKATSLGQSYVLENGRLAPSSYSQRSVADAERDGAVPVEQIRITDGPNKRLVGWVTFVQRTFGPWP